MVDFHRVHGETERLSESYQSENKDEQGLKPVLFHSRRYCFGKDKSSKIRDPIFSRWWDLGTRKNPLSHLRYTKNYL